MSEPGVTLDKMKERILHKYTSLPVFNQISNFFDTIKKIQLTTDKIRYKREQKSGEIIVNAEIHKIRSEET